jgi:phospholipid/cholesterol/gamma-HCH transport system ATP-binding protein
MITVNHISKSFGDHLVLDDVSAVFTEGQVNLVIGASGQGKSVMAKCMVGLHEVDKGSIIFDGRDFSAMNRNQRIEIRKEIGMLFKQAHCLIQ